MKKASETKYITKGNNYVGLLFFALVLASLLYIIKHETRSFQELEPVTNAIITKEKVLITDETDQIKDLTNYLNPGDSNTFKIYQSMYNSDPVTLDNLNPETMLYIAYKYIEKNTDFTNYTKYITCEEANKINLTNSIIQCGGNKYNISTYTTNSYITKDILKQTIKKIFNININTFTNFYTSEDNLCYFLENEYLCVSKKPAIHNSYTEKKFVKAYKYNNKIEIIEKYKYINNGIYYKTFNSEEIGESTFISTFIKVNGSYYWDNTKLYQED